MSQSNIPTQAELERLEKYASLLKTVKELSEWIPSEDDVDDVRNYVINLQKVNEIYDAGNHPTEDEMREVADYARNLQHIGDMPSPDEDEMREVAKHADNLRRATRRKLA